RGARRVAVLGAYAGVHGAVLESAGRTHLHMLVTRRQAVHPALGSPVVHTEVLAAHRAAVWAGFAAAVVVAADHQRSGRAATLRTGERPAGDAAERAPRGERRAAPLAGFEPPLGALHQHGRLDELQRMYHRLHLTASDLLGAAALGRRRDRRDPLRVALLLQDRLEVSVQPAELGGERLLRHGAPRRARLRHTVANRNGQLDRAVPYLLKALTPCPPLPSGEGGRGGRRSDQTEPEPRGPRPNRFHHLSDERAAEHGDFGLRVA